MDMDGVSALKEIVDIFESKGKKVYITAVNRLVSDSLKKEKWFVALRDHGRVFESTQDTLAAINAEIDK